MQYSVESCQHSNLVQSYCELTIVTGAGEGGEGGKLLVKWEGQ